MIAVVYRTTATGDQVVAGRIRLVGGKLIGDPPDDPTVQFVLESDAFRHDTLTMVSCDGDPAAFLAALPAAYTGLTLRFGLEGE